MTDARPTSARVLAGLRLLYGLALLLAPDALLGGLSGAWIDRCARRFARVLGAHHVVQAVVAYRRPSRRWILGGATVDGAHAASMTTLALALVGLLEARRN